MCKKIVLFLVCISCLESFAIIVRDAYPSRKRESIEPPREETTPNPSDEYEFSYSVYNDKTRDIKSHEESRKGDKVKGKYTLIDSDGFKRIVDYTANDHEGFIAHVHREPTYHKMPSMKNTASQTVVASRAYNQVYYKSPAVQYSYSF